MFFCGWCKLDKVLKVLELLQLALAIKQFYVDVQIVLSEDDEIVILKSMVLSEDDDLYEFVTKSIVKGGLELVDQGDEMGEVEEVEGEEFYAKRMKLIRKKCVCVYGGEAWAT
nr:hypothetical protein [Tanacetum cinerariifolium]